MELMKSWIMGLMGAALVTAVACSAAPEGKAKRVVTLVCGLMTILALMRPVLTFDYGAFAKNLAAYERSAQKQSFVLVQSNEKLTRRIIEERCASYILDKGKSQGIDDLQVTVTAAWSQDGYWYPAKATLRTASEQAKRDSLSRSIVADLGIPPEELSWSMQHES